MHTDALDEFVRLSTIARPFYGGLVLSGAGREDDEAGIIQTTTADSPLPAICGDKSTGLLNPFYLSESVELSSFTSAMLRWSTMSFSDFSFDMLATMNGTYHPTLGSSMHGFDIGKLLRGDDGDPK